MKTMIDSIDGELCLEAGSGWMSRFEASQLASGDVVLCDNLAGQAMTLSFNGSFFAQADLVIADLAVADPAAADPAVADPAAADPAVADPAAEPGGSRNANKKAVCAARIRSLTPNAWSAPVPDRGSEACELVPFTIRLACARYALKSLEGSGEATLVHMNTAYTEEGNARLYIAGFPAARGTLVVRDENWGIRIDEAEGSLAAGSEIRTTSAYLRAGGEAQKAKTYDARRPDFVTKPMLDLFSAVHEEFARSLRAVYPAAKSVRLVSTDQLAFYEWVEPKSGAEQAVSMLSMRPTGRTAQNEAAGELPAKLCVNPEIRAISRDTGDCADCGPEAALPLFDDAFEADYRAWWRNRSPGEDGCFCLLSSGHALARIFPDAEDRQQFAACLRNGWKRCLDARFAELREFPAAGASNNEGKSATDKSAAGATDKSTAGAIDKSTAGAPGWKKEDLYEVLDAWAMILTAVFAVATDTGEETFELAYPLSALQSLCPRFRA
ncbi:hypothetical protein K7J14_10130 [Treponema zuelzerae]|uniref:Uncharacterized protein n=1 Tax=Teretinema zuelzerae TaxID=156 RepID=A0AAE3EHG3_9SPIR|nr:hypothetical protein [Teretinema zuelzerae]MCD1655055.1 hypothetical protein [Teretinema zuelzerae]